ncbi:Por secretion system C-terminal sorting domain-containing protein, partial [Flexibacter flexilis DSM 6793]
DSPSPAFYDLYFMKVGGIGLPYLPETDSSWLVTSSKPVLSSGAKVSIYPNPAREVLHIERSGVTGVLSVMLQNVLGKIMYEGEMSESSTLSLSGYASGLYFLRVREGSSLLLEQKVLITE